MTELAVESAGDRLAQLENELQRWREEAANIKAYVAEVEAFNIRLQAENDVLRVRLGLPAEEESDTGDD